MEEYNNLKHEKDKNTGSVKSASSTVHLMEREILLGVFPAEIWDHIFDVIEDPDTLMSCAKASPFLKELLEEKRIVYLFPQVIKTLVGQNYLVQNGWADILSCRLVCKNWKVGVNRLLECPDPSKNAHCDKHHDTCTDKPCSPLGFRLYKSTILDKLESEILPLTSSPIFQATNLFPTRHLEILEGRLVNTLAFEWYDTSAFTRFRSLTNKFLQIAGHHFWHAEICIWVDATALEWVNLFWKYAWLLPNLRSLQIQCPNFEESHLNELSAQLPPFPKLSELQYLSMKDAPIPIINSILKANPHIKTLIIHKRDGLSPNEDETLQLLGSTDLQTASIYVNLSSGLKRLH